MSSVRGPHPLIQPRGITTRENQHIERLYKTTYKHTYFTAHVNRQLEICDKNEHRTKSNPPRIASNVKVHDNHKSPTLWQHIAYAANTIWWFLIAQHGIGAGNETYFDHTTRSEQSKPIRRNANLDQRERRHIGRLRTTHNRLVDVVQTMKLKEGNGKRYYELEGDNVGAFNELIPIFDRYLSRRADEIAGSDALLKREIMQAGVAELRSKFKIPVKSKRYEKALADGAANEHLPRKDIAKASETSMIHKLSQAAKSRALEERTKFVNSCHPDALLGPNKLRILADFADQYFAIVHQYNPEYDPKTTITKQEEEEFVVQLRNAIVNTHELANSPMLIGPIARFTKKQKELTDPDSVERRERDLRVRLETECAQSESRFDAVSREMVEEQERARRELDTESRKLAEYRQEDDELSRGIVATTESLQPMVEDLLITPRPYPAEQAVRLGAFNGFAEHTKKSRNAMIALARQEEVCRLTRKNAFERAAKLKVKLETAEADLVKKQQKLANIDQILNKEHVELQNQARWLSFFTAKPLDRKCFLAAVYPRSSLATLFLSGAEKHKKPINTLAGFLLGNGIDINDNLDDVRNAQSPLGGLAHYLSIAGRPRDPELRKEMRLIEPALDEMLVSYPEECDRAELHGPTTTTNWGVSNTDGTIQKVENDYSANEPYKIVTDKTTGEKEVIGVAEELSITTVSTTKDYNTTRLIQDYFFDHLKNTGQVEDLPESDCDLGDHKPSTKNTPVDLTPRSPDSSFTRRKRRGSNASVILTDEALFTVDLTPRNPDSSFIRGARRRSNASDTSVLSINTDYTQFAADTPFPFAKERELLEDSLRIETKHQRLPLNEDGPSSSSSSPTSETITSTSSQPSKTTGWLSNWVSGFFRKNSVPAAPTSSASALESSTSLSSSSNSSTVTPPQPVIFIPFINETTPPVSPRDPIPSRLTSSSSSSSSFLEDVPVTPSSTTSSSTTSLSSSSKPSRISRLGRLALPLTTPSSTTSSSSSSSSSFVGDVPVTLSSTTSSSSSSSSSFVARPASRAKRRIRRKQVPVTSSSTTSSSTTSVLSSNRPSRFFDLGRLKTPLTTPSSTTSSSSSVSSRGTVPIIDPLSSSSESDDDTLSLPESLSSETQFIIPYALSGSDDEDEKELPFRHSSEHRSTTTSTPSLFNRLFRRRTPVATTNNVSAPLSSFSEESALEPSLPHIVGSDDGTSPHIVDSDSDVGLESSIWLTLEDNLAADSTTSSSSSSSSSTDFSFGRLIPAHSPGLYSIASTSMTSSTTTPLAMTTNSAPAGNVGLSTEDKQNRILTARRQYDEDVADLDLELERELESELELHPEENF